ncbi:MAG: radical SAM protein [Deltaproteobacteria bacterium]|nr:radical SAM protein [Deltaproteobacteria bacterium]
MTKPGTMSPKICAWELTLACNARCIHCGSSAGAPREDELTTEEALGLIDDLAALDCEAVTFSGGEPFLRKDWPLLAESLLRAGVRTEAITNGLCVSEQADAIASAGFNNVTFSVDGTAKTHDRIRGVSGGLERLLEGVGSIANRGTHIGAVTQINLLNWRELDQIHDLLVTNGFEGWQVQLTMPHGRAADNREELCLAQQDLLTLENTLLKLHHKSPIFIQIADNIGYLGRNEPKLRAGASPTHKIWGGCQAGLQVIGITSDGTIRGCLSMPPALNEGNIRERPLSEIWNDPKGFSYNRQFDAASLDGTCSKCPLGPLCRGGCKSLAYAYTGDLNSNPYCLRRLADETNGGEP